MTKIIMWNLMTLDGLFEGQKSWDLDFHEYVWGPELEALSIEQLASADMLLFGRVTYEGMAAYWQSETGEIASLMNAIPKVVFSNTLEKVEWENSSLVHGRAEDEVAAIKQRPGRNAFIFGSADLSASLMKMGLIDEYRIAIVPVVLGGGKPLFKPSPERTVMRLLESRSFASGGVLLRYKPNEGEKGVG